MEDETASQAAISAWMTNFSLRMTSADPGHVRPTRNVETHTVPEQIGDPFGLWGGKARKEFVEHSLCRAQLVQTLELSSFGNGWVSGGRHAGCPGWLVSDLRAPQCPQMTDSQTDRRRATRHEEFVVASRQGVVIYNALPILDVLRSFTTMEPPSKS